MERGTGVLGESTYSHEQRLVDDTTTWLAETLEGGMRSTFEYSYHDGELYAHDGSPMREVFEAALRDAETMARDPNMAFELRRRQLELEEYRCMLQMAEGVLPNTMVVVSDFPPELMQSGHSLGGYNASRKQTMLRVISRRSDGKIVMCSQSLDCSDRRALEAMYDSLNFSAMPGELLGQRMHLELADEDQEFLIDSLMGVYDQTMSRVYGGQWYAGRSGLKRANTYSFVQAQTDLLHVYFDHYWQYGYSQRMEYNLAAAMKRRYAEQVTVGSLFHPGYVQYGSMSEQAFATEQDRLLVMYELQQSGEDSRQSGDVFLGCGKAVGGSPDAQSDARKELQDSGYGNKAQKSKKERGYKFDKYTYCRVCQKPPKSGESKKFCGPCEICEPCTEAIEAKE